MLLALALLVQSPTASAPTPSASTSGPEVVVTGERLKKIHDQCRQGKCTPLRDAQASIAWAESQFREGRYVDAKNTLRDASGRAKRYAATDPKPAAAVFEAHATISWQEGDQDVYRDAVARRVRTLRDHLPPDDPHVRAAALALGDMWMRLNEPMEAERAYARAEREAVDAGQGDVAIRARLARARVRKMLGDRTDALALLASAGSLPGGDGTAARGAIQAMRLRFATEDGDDAAIARAADELRAGGLTRPVLLWAPPYPETATQIREGARDLAQSLSGEDAVGDRHSAASDITGIQWADIGFWIRPDGRTADIEVLRASYQSGWTAPYMGQIARRRYAASVGAPGDPGTYRIERFTLRGNYAVPKGSLIRRRVGATKLEVIDLTDSAARVTARR